MTAARRGAAALKAYIRLGALGADPELLLDMLDLCRCVEEAVPIRKRDVPPDVWAKLTDAGEPTPAKRPKYGNRKVAVDGLTFDSAKEARRYAELRLLEAAGSISGLETQVEFRLEVGGVLVARYVADFAYVEGGARVVEDCKGFKTREYRMKRKLMRACHGIEIKET